MGENGICSDLFDIPALVFALVHWHLVDLRFKTRWLLGRDGRRWVRRRCLILHPDGGGTSVVKAPETNRFFPVIVARSVRCDDGGFFVYGRDGISVHFILVLVAGLREVSEVFAGKSPVLGGTEVGERVSDRHGGGRPSHARGIHAHFGS